MVAMKYLPFTLVHEFIYQEYRDSSLEIAQTIEGKKILISTTEFKMEILVWQRTTGMQKISAVLRGTVLTGNG